MVVVFTNGDKVQSLEIEPARDVKANDKSALFPTKPEPSSSPDFYR